LESRTAEIGAAAKELAIKAWFNEFFAGLDTRLSDDGKNIWLVTDNVNIQFDIVFTQEGVRLCHDYFQTGEWQNECKVYSLYQDFTAENLVEELEQVFVGLVQKLTR